MTTTATPSTLITSTRRPSVIPDVNTPEVVTQTVYYVTASASHTTVTSTVYVYDSSSASASPAPGTVTVTASPTHTTTTSTVYMSYSPSPSPSSFSSEVEPSYAATTTIFSGTTVTAFYPPSSSSSLVPTAAAHREDFRIWWEPYWSEELGRWVYYKGDAVVGELVERDNDVDVSVHDNTQEVRVEVDIK